MKGDKNCVICGKWLGNYLTGESAEGTASYYSLIKRKYCSECRKWKRTLDYRFYCAEYHKRKKKKDKERDQQKVYSMTEHMTVEQADGMTIIIIVILLGIAAGVMMPLFTMWVKHIVAFIKRRRAMYKAYLSRLDDFMEYHKFMEQCEYEYQVKWLLDIQAQAERELKDFIQS